MAHAVNSNRTHYDLARAYCWNQPLETVFRKTNSQIVNTEDEEDTNLDSQVSARFPNLRLPLKGKRLKKDRPKYELDMNTLLHIRNFWHRHLIDDSTGFGEVNHKSMYVASDLVGENTYAAMVRKLVRVHSFFDEQGISVTPGPWRGILKDAWTADEADRRKQRIARKWFGHYSCVHPWPKRRDRLEEQQSCAEDWSEVDPLVRRFSLPPFGCPGSISRAWWR